MSVASKVMEFLSECPYMREFEQLFPVVELDVLGESPTTYMVESTPAEPILKRYANGDTERQYVFSLCSREFYGAPENVDTSEFYENFSDWLNACTKEGKLPDLKGNLTSKSIRATTEGYLYDTQEQKCQYRIQCQFIYYKRR